MKKTIVTGNTVVLSIAVIILSLMNAPAVGILVIAIGYIIGTVILVILTEEKK